jgi:hypothetical protein
MKRIASVILLSAVASIAAPPLVPIKLAWRDTNNVPVLSQYSPTTNNCYLLVGTNDLTAPISTWPVISVFTSWTLGTNAGLIWYTNSVTVAPDNWFFSIIASNFWGQVAIPSNVAQTGPVSTPPVSLNLSR